ncbi:hypothetical protein CKAH01_14480 [Colletotrichum kahawae]|uniref:Ankyrin repeat protein n=1 Tax=Colletotrichum kahawae TaxID=34407 RepID=A0AAD9YMZ9_COLKA|nr:hypothetical protein CKAH01_14480 [Colletotrichum kahawae]
MLENVPSLKKARGLSQRPVWACIKGGSLRNNKCLRALVEAGAKIKYRKKKTGKTTIQVAVEQEYFKDYTNLKCMLMSRKEAEPNVKDSTGDCPVTQLFSGAEMAQAGASRNSAPTPLSKYRPAAMAILLQHGTDVVNSTQPETGNSPLHFAVLWQDRLAVAKLLYKKANVNAITKWGISPLNIAVNHGEGADRVAFFKDLVSMGLQSDAKFGNRGSIADMTLKKLFVKQSGGTREKDAPDSAPATQPDAQPESSFESLSELNLNTDPASDQEHSHMGFAYNISTDYGTSGSWYEAGWPGNSPEYDFHINLEELEDRYPAAWLQAFARWIEQYDDLFVAGGCDLSSQGVLFPNLEERKAWSVEGALLAA